MEQGEIVIYKASDSAEFQIEVRVEDETVWLTQTQMVNLFDATKQNISLHINNVFNEGELQRNSVVKEYLTTASDRKRYKTKFYNLDVIISVGYRVKSLRGTQFRIWANKILKEYLLKGYVINHRIEKIEKEVEVKTFAKSHDRFLIIDLATIYHIGASLKDLGKKPVVSLSNYGLPFQKSKLTPWKS